MARLALGVPAALLCTASNSISRTSSQCATPRAQLGPVPSRRCILGASIAIGERLLASEYVRNIQDAELDGTEPASAARWLVVQGWWRRRLFDGRSLKTARLWHKSLAACPLHQRQHPVRYQRRAWCR